MQLLEFEKMDYTLQFEKKVVQALLNYVCFSHNCFSPVQEEYQTLSSNYHQMILGCLSNWCMKGRECLSSQWLINPLKVSCL